mgnify:CR=1 FL=1
MLVAGALTATAITLVEILAVIWALTWLTGTIAGTDISAVILGRGLVNVWPLAMAFGVAARFCRSSVVVQRETHNPATFMRAPAAPTR